MQVHLRFTKSKKDRFVPLPQATLLALRLYWQTHRHPRMLFPGGKPPHTRNRQDLVMDITSKEPWRSSKTQGIQQALNNGYLTKAGLYSLRDGWIKVHYPNQGV